MKSPLFIDNVRLNGSQQVIYIFNKMRVKVNTQRSRVKKCKTQRLPPIKQLLTDDIISENWRTPGLPTGNYYVSLGNKYAYFYTAHCVNENPAFSKLYKTLIRPHLAYGNVIWSPLYKKDIEAIEMAQKRATKLVYNVRNMSYCDRLKALRLPSLTYRRF